MLKNRGKSKLSNNVLFNANKHVFHCEKSLGTLFYGQPSYKAYHLNHPAGTAWGGTAIIIKYSIKHHQLNNYSHNFLQATSVSAEHSVGLLTISAVYLPPRHTVKRVQFKDFNNTLGRQFTARGDYNPKHADWGSRLITTKGCELLKTMQCDN
jgi:hypothetical protein